MNMAKHKIKNEDGFFTMIIILLLILAAVVYFAYLRVQHAHQG